MRRLTVGSFALALVFVASGCGDTPDSVTQDQIKVLNEMANVLEGIKDKDSAEQAKPKLEALSKKMKDIEERSKKLKLNDLPKEKQDALAKKYKNDLEKTGMRYESARRKVEFIPDAKAALKGLELPGLDR